MIYFQLIITRNDILHFEVDIIATEAVCHHILVRIQNEDNLPLTAAYSYMEQLYSTVIHEVFKTSIDDVICTEAEAQH